MIALLLTWLCWPWLIWRARARSGPPRKILLIQTAKIGDMLCATPVMAALRESCEEIALPTTQVQALGYLDPFVTISSFRITPVVAVIDPSFVPQPEPNEVADVFEVPLDYLLAPDSLRRVEVDYRGRRRVVLEYGWPGQRIWGATAAILFNLRERLERSA